MKSILKIKNLFGFDPLVGFNRCDILKRCFSSRFSINNGGSKCVRFSQIKKRCFSMNGEKYILPPHICINSSFDNIVFKDSKSVLMIPSLKPLAVFEENINYNTKIEDISKIDGVEETSSAFLRFLISFEKKF